MAQREWRGMAWREMGAFKGSPCLDPIDIDIDGNIGRLAGWLAGWDNDNSRLNE